MICSNERFAWDESDVGEWDKPALLIKINQRLGNIS